MLNGAAATARLKEQGQYESLMQAVQSARYAVETVNATTDNAQGGECYAGNPTHSLRCWFRAGGLELQPAGTKPSPWKLNLRLQGFGRTVLKPAEVGSVCARQNRVELSRANGAVVEWYENEAVGLEQGFTVQRPPQSDGGPLRLVLEVDGDLRPELEEGNTVVKFVSADGWAVLRYSGLKVWDAAGRELAAHIEVEGRQLALVVNDHDAAYPVTLDPLITSQEAKLGPEVTGDGAENDEFGCSVALSGDTVLVGALGDDTSVGPDAGSAYVFVRTGANWSQQAKLTAADAAAGAYFGHSVALSEDTALVGASGDDTAAWADAGSAYVFVRSGTNWSQQAKLTAADEAANDFLGTRVALSGNTALVGALGDDTTAGADAGSAYVFVRSGTNWSQQAKLTAADAAANDSFGNSVALSGDTALVGASGDDTTAGADAGSAYVFERSGTNWSQQAKLTPGDEAAGDYFGYSVALSEDTALVGAVGDDTAAEADAGSVYVFVRSGTNWSQQTKFTADDAAANDNFGNSVALVGDTALVGEFGDDTPAGSDAGSAYVFVRSATNWSQQAKLTAADAAANDSFGNSVALWGDTALVGAFHDGTGAGVKAGSACVFVLSGTNWSEQARLSAGDAAAGNYFGCSVALSQDTALVGAFGDDTAVGANTGSAYVFVRSGTTWSQQAKLTADDTAANDSFGYSVALSGETALVGAPGDDTATGPDAGSAYVFVRSGTTWSQQAKLTADIRANYANFGHSVGVWGDTALVGAVYESNAAGPNAGSAYVFVRSGTTWSQQAKLLAFDEAANDWFGNSVALWGDTALVGARRDNTATRIDAGSAHVFVRSGTTWSQQAKLTAADGATEDYFGISVSLSGDAALIGASGDDTPAGTNAGSAYVFARSGTNWSQQAKLTAGDGAFEDYFGISVALWGDTALVGAPLDNSAVGKDAGSAYVFVRSGTNWSQQSKLTAGDGAENDEFGWSVVLSGDTALVGAVYDDTAAGVDVGSTYVFRFPTPPAIATQPASRTNHVGTAATFIVTATGTEPLNYQWIRDGTNYLTNGGNVSGATTDTLTLANVQDADAGSYTVVITNNAGSTNSAPATLTVIPPLKITSTVLGSSGLVLSGAGGSEGATYFVLASTNVAEWLTNWVRVATNTFGVSGTFSVTNAVDPAKQKEFFCIQMP